jgi:hypothetical protein
VGGTVRLLLLRWPSTASGPGIDGAAMVDLFTACRILLTADGYTVVAVPPATADQVQHLWQRVPAARTAGLGRARLGAIAPSAVVAAQLACVLLAWAIRSRRPASLPALWIGVLVGLRPDAR